MIVNESLILAFLRLPDSELIMSSLSLKKKKKKSYESKGHSLLIIESPPSSFMPGN